MPITFLREHAAFAAAPTSRKGWRGGITLVVSALIVCSFGAILTIGNDAKDVLNHADKAVWTEKNATESSDTTTNNNDNDSEFSFEIVITILHSRTDGKTDQGEFLIMPEVADIPVNLFAPEMQPFPYLVDRTGPVTYFPHVNGRKTQEVTGYLQFIVNRYDSLPDVTIFLHPSTQKHGERIPESIRHVVDHWTPEQIGFLHLNYEILVCRAVNQDGNYRKIWKTLGFNESHHPNYISVPCCAQFMVTKERILLRPKSFYQKFLDEAYEWAKGDESGFPLALFSEYHWHLIFGEPPILSQDRQVVFHMLSGWSKEVPPNGLSNPIPSLPCSDSMKEWYEKSIADPGSYFPHISTKSEEACPPGSRLAL